MSEHTKEPDDMKIMLDFIEEYGAKVFDSFDRICAGMYTAQNQRDEYLLGLEEWRDMAQDAIHERESLKSQRDELLAVANRHAFRECQLVETLKAYIAKYGPGYSCTDRLAYDNAIGVLAVIANAENGKPEC